MSTTDKWCVSRSGLHAVNASCALYDGKGLYGLIGALYWSQAKAGPEEVAKARRAVRQAIVDHAEVVACTLSAAGGDLLNLTHTGRPFDAVLTDEVMLCSLIPGQDPTA